MGPHNDAFARLEEIVAATAIAIRRGDLQAMADLAAQTESALSNLGPQVDPARITVLRDLATRNATGLEAAAKGVRAARRRLAEVLNARKGMQTYDIAGKPLQIGGSDNTIKARL